MALDELPYHLQHQEIKMTRLKMPGVLYSHPRLKQHAVIRPSFTHQRPVSPRGEPF